jgi:hypothetical protein
MITMADGLGEVLNATPESVKQIGQQFVNKLTDTNAAPAAPTNDTADLAKLVPEIVQMIEKKMDLEAIKSLSVKEVLAQLSEKATKKEKLTIEKAQQTLAMLPVLNDLPFEELYLRVTN